LIGWFYRLIFGELVFFISKYETTILRLWSFLQMAWWHSTMSGTAVLSRKLPTRILGKMAASNGFGTKKRCGGPGGQPEGRAVKNRRR
jgi:hypothetical protein